MSWWSNVLKQQSEDWVFAWLDGSQVPPGTAQGNVEADSQYLHVFLKSARVVDVRKGFQTFYGTVHSYTSLPHRSGGNAEFNVVTTPSALKNVDASGLDRVIQLNQRLVGPVPYVGGDLELEVGLFSIAASNLAAPYLDLLESLSKTAGVSFVSAALPFAEPILQGMKLLTGSTKDVALEIGFSTTLQEPRLGYLAVIRAPKTAISADGLSVDPGDFRLRYKGAPLATYPYVVVEVSARPNRPDWHQIPELAEAYKRVQEEYRAGRDAGTQEALGLFRRIALTCNDLLDTDARTLVDKVNAQYEAMGPPAPSTRGARTRSGRAGAAAGPGGAAEKAMPDLSQIDLYQ